MDWFICFCALRRWFYDRRRTWGISAFRRKSGINLEGAGWSRDKTQCMHRTNVVKYLSRMKELIAVDCVQV